MQVASGPSEPLREPPSAPARVELSPWDTADWTRQAVALPNLFTYTRILAVPVFIWAFLEGRASLALIVFVAAAVTDGIDGLLARTLHMQTRLGTFLDPIADKLLTFSALVLLVARGMLPTWLLALVLVRDGGIVLAAAHLRMNGIFIPSIPTRFGKYATFTLLATIALALVRSVHPSPQLDAYVAASSLLALQCVTIAIVQYSMRWRRLMRAQ